MQVFITGATGFLGTHVTEKLLNAEHSLTLLVRPQSTDTLDQAHTDRCNIIKGDILSPGTIRKGCHDADVIIHLVGIIREFPPEITFERLHEEATFNVVRAAQATDTDILYVSALGARDGTTDYYQSKRRAETLVRESGQAYTILRPSVILGPGDHITPMIQNQARLGF
ncbi:MAG: SDR family oxidoreductase, partial [Halobacteriaceae archaeon]